MEDRLDPGALAAAMAALAADFDAAMPGRIAGLRRSVALARTGVPDGLDDLVDGMHRLAGNAGTFGHGDISVAARALEAALEAELATGAPGATGPQEGRADVLDAVSAFVDDLSARFPPAGSV